MLVTSPDALEALVRTATGVGGLFVVFLYSFLVAFALPLPGEVVLAAPLSFGVPWYATLAVVIVVSSAGKALGSLVALHVGQTATRSPSVARVTRWLPTPPRWFDGFVERYGYLGLTLTLSVPLLPDTASVYAFSVLDTDYRLFAAAAFVGSALRLVATASVVAGVLAVV